MIRSRFSCCPVFLMFFSRISNNLINKVHERSLIIVSAYNHVSFEYLLEKCQEITIHQRNLQVLITEMYKTVNSISPPIMKNFLA